MSYFVIMESSAQVKGKAKYGRYTNVAVVEVEDGHPWPAMISKRAKGVVRIVRHYGACSVGKTDRCQYRQALAEAEALVVALKNGVTS